MDGPLRIRWDYERDEAWNELRPLEPQPMSPEATERRLAAILHADVVSHGSGNEATPWL